MLLFPTKFRKRKRLPHPGTVAPSNPVAANVSSVTGAFGSADTVWTFDRPVMVESGGGGGGGAGGWEVFTLAEDGGPQTRQGVDGLQLTSTTIRVTMENPVEDYGNDWFWELNAMPSRVKTLDGGQVNPGEGDLLLE